MKKLFFLAFLFTCSFVFAQNAAQYIGALDAKFEQNPKLADLLGPMSQLDGDRQAALQTWQEFVYRNSAPGADPSDVKAQMKAALQNDSVPNDVKVWLIMQFQRVGTAADLDALVPFLTSQEYTLRDEAIRTISAIPGDEAVSVLKKASEKADDADRQRIAQAIRQRKQDISSISAETEFPQALPYVSATEAEAFLKGWAGFSVEKKIRTLASLTVLGNREYTKYAVEAARTDGDDENARALRREGILALEKLATVNEIPLLLESLNFDRNLVILVTSRVETEGFDAALIKAMNGADAGTFSALCAILADRNVNVFQEILKRLSSDDCPDRNWLMESVCKMATKAETPALAATLGRFKEGRDRDEAEKRVAAVCAGDSSALIETKIEIPEEILLPFLGRVGDDAAWNRIDAGLKDEKLRDAALRGLCNLPNAKQAEKMLAVVDGDSVNADQKIQALRAYIRVVSLRDEEIGIRANSQKKLEMLREALKRVTRIDEKKLILSRLNAIRDRKTAEFAMEFFADPDLQQDAYRAFLDVAHHDNVRRPNADFFRPVLEEIIRNCKDQNQVERAKNYLKNL